MKDVKKLENDEQYARYGSKDSRSVLPKSLKLIPEPFQWVLIICFKLCVIPVLYSQV